MPRILAVIVLLSLGAVAAADRPYAGLETREIKSLSAEEVEGYLAGRGMGLALPAELNGFPGPKHVLELGDELALRPEQVERTRDAFDRMHAEAVRLGRLLVDGERRLDALFAAGEVDREALRRRVAEISRVRGSLRSAHLEAHLEMMAILDPEQIQRYAALRGYRTATEGHAPGGPDCPHGGG